MSEVGPEHSIIDAVQSGLIVLGRTAESEKMVLSLSRFLRYTLARTPSQLTTLADEIGMLRQYLEIEAARFSDRLKVTWDVTPDCMQAMVPSLVLLPLVENALKYGLGGSERPVEIVNAIAPGLARLVVLPKTAHGLMAYETAAAAFSGGRAQNDGGAGRAVNAWLRERFADR